MPAPNSQQFALPSINSPHISGMAIMVMPNIQAEIIKNYSLDEVILDFLKETYPKMREEKIRNLKTQWAERDSDFDSAIISAVNVGGAPNVVLTLSTSDMTTIDGVPRSPGLVGDDILLGVAGTRPTKGRIISKNTGTNPHTITVAPYSAADNLVTAAVVGKTIVFATRSTTEASMAVSGIASENSYFDNVIGIQRHGYVITDLARQQKTWFKFKNSQGQTMDCYTYQADLENAMNFLKMVVMEMNIGTRSNLTQVAADGQVYPIRGTDGILTQIHNRGNELPYNVSPTLGGLYQVRNIMRDNGVQGKVKAKHGDYYTQNFEQTIAQSLPNGAITYDKNNLEFGVMNIKLSGFSFTFKEEKLFSHKHLLGAPGMPYRSSSYYSPEQDSVDTVTGQRKPSIHNVYIEAEERIGTGDSQIMGIDKPFFAVWNEGALSATNKTSNSILQMNMIAKFAPVVMGAKQHVVHYKA